ncbi:MAG: D-alanine--D-alanine ligase [Fibrobacter sp.]|jgi:D-alanine-D-alanine ligase|nr:D-alanine--D-alanine ligase [Fibrobacter sp.]
MPRLRVLVLMGGPSLEHEVSVVSGVNVVRAMNPEKYNVHPVFIGKDDMWSWSSRELSPYQQQNFSENYFHALDGSASRREKSPALSMLPDADIAFLALHGKWGEDGHVQALLEHWKIPYTGSGFTASAVAMDKIISKEVYKASGIPTPPYTVLLKSVFSGDKLLAAADLLGFPLVIKDPLGGSSIGMGIAKTLEEAEKLCLELFQNTEKLLLERFIAGEEASCGYMEGVGNIPPTEMRMTSQEFFDYDAKYLGKSQEITPAEFSAERTRAIRELSRNAHEALGCAVYSRTDVRIDALGNLWALETNTLPGMTPTSILPAEMASIGISYAGLIDLIIEKSLSVKR